MEPYKEQTDYVMPTLSLKTLWNIAIKKTGALAQ